MLLEEEEEKVWLGFMSLLNKTINNINAYSNCFLIVWWGQLFWYTIANK